MEDLRKAYGNFFEADGGKSEGLRKVCVELMDVFFETDRKFS